MELDKLVQVGLFVALLLIGYGCGRYNEQRHFRSIKQREQTHAGILCFSFKTAPADFTGRAELVTGSVVISIDYFKKVAAALRGLLGGRISAYESLLERARREALLRMKEEAKAMGAQRIINVKLETAAISKNAHKNVGAVEVIAYGTALRESESLE